MILIAGPCQMESRDHCLMMGEKVAEVSARVGLPIVFKASFDKANRTDMNAPRGVGLKAALPIFEEIRRAFGLMVITDVHETWQCAEVGPVVDVLQIPALLSRQTDLIRAAAAACGTVNIKRGPMTPPWAVASAVAKARPTVVWVTERGSPFGHGDLVVDMRGFAGMTGCADAVIFDATHSVQQPAGLGAASGGTRALVEPLALAAVAAGADGLFIETHDDPDNAPSDGPCMIAVDKLGDLIERALDVHRAAHGSPPI